MWEPVETGGIPWAKRLAVPGGWIYSTDHGSPVFVPQPAEQGDKVKPSDLASLLDAMEQLIATADSMIYPEETFRNSEYAAADEVITAAKRALQAARKLARWKGNSMANYEKQLRDCLLDAQIMIENEIKYTATGKHPGGCPMRDCLGQWRSLARDMRNLRNREGSYGN